ATVCALGSARPALFGRDGKRNHTLDGAGSASSRVGREKRLRAGISGIGCGGDVEWDHFGSVVFSCDTDPVGGVAGRGCRAGGTEAERPIKTPTAADHGTHFPGGGV